MNIVLPIIIVVAIGLLAGLLLALASKFMAVPTDEKAEKIRECLPGANCGGCGFSGCDGYAAAIASGEAEPNKCAVMGADALANLAEILGVEISTEKKAAFIACGGTPENSVIKFNYTGLETCAAAAMTAGGPLQCEFGCMGYGDCMRACKFGAITLKDGRPMICEELCAACGACAAACPKNLIKILPKNGAARVNCSNCNKGPAVVKACKVSCIACGMCVKACPSGAIKLENNVAVVDPALCTGCGECKNACKRGAII